MRRAGKQSVAAAALTAALLAAPAARAYHAGAVFDKPPGAGGTDGNFYTGAPYEHGWQCTLCHQSPAGQIKLHDLIGAARTEPVLQNGQPVAAVLFRSEFEPLLRGAR